MPYGNRATTNSGSSSGLIITAIVSVLVGVVLWLCLHTSERELTVDQFSWTRSIEVERYRTITETDWSVPEGGRLVREFQAEHHTNRVADGTTREWTYGYDAWKGKFRWHWATVTKYKKVPVMQTKFEYQIERWCYERTEQASGTDHSPRWPEVTLGEQERQGESRAEYTADFVEVKDPSRHYSRTYSAADWEALDKNAPYIGKFDHKDKLLEVHPLLLETSNK